VTDKLRICVVPVVVIKAVGVVVVIGEVVVEVVAFSNSSISFSEGVCLNIVNCVPEIRDDLCTRLK